MKVLWLSGYAGSGKDTAAEILCRKYGYTRVAFADMLKDYVAAKYGFDRTLCDTGQGKETVIHQHRTVRELLIEESALAKTDDLDIFSKQALQKIHESTTDKIVISDWRYPHEILYIKHHMDSKTIHKSIRITRPGLNSLKDPSEHALDYWEFDVRLENKDLRLLEELITKNQ
jgi:hypothetical protein